MEKAPQTESFRRVKCGFWLWEGQELLGWEFIRGWHRGSHPTRLTTEWCNKWTIIDKILKMKLQWWIRQYLIKIRLSESLWFLVSDILALFVEWKCVLWNTSLPASSIGKPRCYYWTPPRWPDWQTQNGKPDFIVSSYDLLFRDVRVKPSWLPLDQSINFKDIYIVVTFKWHCQVTEFCPWLLYCFYHLL